MTWIAIKNILKGKENPKDNMPAQSDKTGGLRKLMIDYQRFTVILLSHGALPLTKNRL